MDSPNRETIIEPSLRPLDPEATSGRRRRFGLVLLATGFVTILVGGFSSSFGQWLFIAGTIFILAGLFLLGRFIRSSHREEKEDIRKLYRHE
jgi:hypothetical protein